jgi:hypothetical protein
VILAKVRTIDVFFQMARKPQYAVDDSLVMMNIYGKQASAFYNCFDGLRYFERGKDQAVVVPCEENDEIAEELVEFADCIRGDRVPEMGGLPSLWPRFEPEYFRSKKVAVWKL